MRALILPTLALALALPALAASPAMAQGVPFPTLDFPQPGTFCGPLQLCQPLTTRDAGR